MTPRLPLRLAAVLVPLAACAGGSTPKGTANDATVVTEETDAGAGGGRYTQGVYTCCAEGEERACCPPETLPDPATGRSATCFPYGGARGRCVAAGGTLEAKDICSICCPGLARLATEAPTGDAGACEDQAPPSVFLCAACGDGTCGAGENACNCPADCT
ncbi:MAG: hypothetical protein KIS78_16190 [Labilithrix sp.]|nr:hypothetical protein [Labilithrix sp.]